ncbi:hypothetical protein [Bradyrhizobium sp. AUGA SZCCT0182]|uniref:hypothetical protein n=1 Tax=Bradyrhizobium sp. AUGA SZCCT0182 TaxID=2807667 RepID=UPI001BADB737|nr:hypothetical protein [Bradyrhizobium sp. AUGA SZCCT0182]MBR1237892.1 hypothetical protein [Bradyrhizobium sp. AUGA SZCCT0182]
MSKMQGVADGVEHRQAVLVVSADDSVYVSEMPFYLRVRKARIREIGLRLILAPPILISRGGKARDEALESKAMSEVYKIKAAAPKHTAEVTHLHKMEGSNYVADLTRLGKIGNPVPFLDRNQMDQNSSCP